MQYIMVASTCTLLSPSSLYQKWPSYRGRILWWRSILSWNSYLREYEWPTVGETFLYSFLCFFSFVVKSTAPTLCPIFFFRYLHSPVPSISIHFILFFVQRWHFGWLGMFRQPAFFETRSYNLVFFSSLDYERKL